MEVRREGSNVSDDNRMPVAVIGCGRMGRLHARVYSEMPSVRLVGVCDADASVAAAVADQYQCRPYTSERDLLKEQPGLRAITIAVPTIAHADVAEQVMKAGISCL